MKTIKLRTRQNTIQTYWLKYSFIILFSCAFNNLNAQENYLEKYKDYTELQTVYNEEYNITIDKNKKLHITQNNHEETLVLTDKATGIRTTESVLFSDLLPLISYEAYTVNSVNNKDKKTQIAKINESKHNRNNIFDSDLKLKEFTFTNLVQGSKKVLKYTVFFKDPYLLHRFNIGVYSPSVKRVLTINHPNNVSIDYKMFNALPNSVKVEKNQKKNQNTITFTIDNPTIIKYSEDAPGILYQMPHLHFWVTNYTVDNQTVNVLGTTEKLYNYYKTFIKNINTKENAELKSFTLNLVADKNTELEKLKTIFNWVQKNIKYIAFESGYEGFIPREAADVFTRKYGDCKDMASIICEMSKYANIKNVNFTWIGSRELPYSYSDLPTLAADNHMIASYINNNEVIYLDATDSHVPFGLPSGFIQGKEALIAQNETFIIKKTPEISAFINASTDSIDLQLTAEKLIGTASYTSKGLLATNYRNMIGDNQKLRKNFVKELVEKGNDKFKLVNFEEIDFDKPDNPYTINYNFELDNYLLKSGNETYINLALNKPIVSAIIENSRMLSLDLEMLQENNNHISLRFPKTTELVSVPENISFENDLLKYHIKYTKKENQVAVNYQIITKKTIIHPTDFKLWNETLQNLKEQLSENLILKNNEKN